MDRPVDLRIDDAIAIITLNRPDKRNALSEHMMKQLRAAALRAAGEPRVRVAVLTGTHNVFCAGGDLGDLGDLDDTVALARRHQTFLTAAETIVELRIPTVAAVNGAAVGAGLALALLCDLVVVQDAAKLRLGFLGVGLPPDLFAAVSLQARLGATRAADMLLRDRPIDAQEAVAIGLANETAPDALDGAVTRARELAVHSSHALEQTVRLLRSARPDATVTRTIEAMAVATAVGTDEFKQATARFRAG